MPHRGTNYVHLHLVSDATGETLITVARAAAAQYANVSPVEHMHPLVRSHKQLDRVLAEIENAPGIVLYTLLEKELATRLEEACRNLGVPYLSILGPVLQLFQAYLGGETKPRIGAQHTLNAEYFKRIDALNYTMLHDDGQHVDDLEQADVVLVGVSRTSKTPTSIYLANRPHRHAGADRADPPEPAARAQGGTRCRPVYRQAGGGRGDRGGAQALRPAQLADH
jgi:regulator of PEP synthase PpsR (kinase-PPPase family)